MPKQKKGGIRYLLSFLFGLIGGLLALGLTTLLMIQVTLKTANANTDKPGVGILFTFWMFGIPMIFAIGAALGVKCVDGLYSLGSPARDPTSEETDEGNRETPREAALRQIAEWTAAENQSSFLPIRWYRKYRRFYAQLLLDIEHPVLYSPAKTAAKPDRKREGDRKSNEPEHVKIASEPAKRQGWRLNRKWAKLGCVLLVIVLAAIYATSVNIWKAVESEDINAITRFARYGDSLNTGATFYGKTPLIHALLLGKKKSFQTLLDLGANPNTICRGGWSALHYAAGESDPFWLKQALAAKGNPNLVNNAGKAKKGTLLWVATCGGHLENVRLLLDAGADIDAYAHNKFTPLANALSYTNFDVALFLLQRGADYRKPATQFETAIQIIQSKNRLVKSGAYNEEEREYIRQINQFLIADGFDPEKASWDYQKLIWK